MTPLVQFFKFVLKQFHQNGCLRLAAGLSYSTILSLTPLLVIAFAMLGAFPAFSGVQESLRSLIFEIFVPSASLQVEEFITGFMQGAGRLTAVGIGALAVTSLILLWNIQESLNHVFAVDRRPPILTTLVRFWTFITLTPLVVGISLSLSASVLLKAQELGFYGVEILSRLHGLGMATMLELMAFVVLFSVFPDRKVKIVHALAGGDITALLVRAFKSLFVLYITMFPTYQMIYGTLASLPIFLLWVYLSWLAILLGAQVTACLPMYGQALPQISPGLDRSVDRLVCALNVIQCVYQEQQSGKPLDPHKPYWPKDSQILVFGVTHLLVAAKVIHQDSDRKITLLKDLHNYKLEQLMFDLGLSADPNENIVKMSSFIKELPKHMIHNGTDEDSGITVANLVCN